MGRKVFSGYYTLRWKILERDNFTCQYCGQKAPNVSLHIDHILSIEDGGDYNPDNLKTACSACNMGKSGLAIIKRRKKLASPYPALLLQPVTPHAFRQDEALNTISEHNGIKRVELAQLLNIRVNYVAVLLGRLKKKDKVFHTNGKWYETNEPVLSDDK